MTATASLRRDPNDAAGIAPSVPVGDRVDFDALQMAASMSEGGPRPGYRFSPSCACSDGGGFSRAARLQSTSTALSCEVRARRPVEVRRATCRGSSTEHIGAVESRDCESARASDPECTADEQLLAEFEFGNEHALGAIYQRYAEKLKALAQGLTRNSDDAEDIVQDAFVRVLRKYSHFEGQSAFYTWLYRIVYNLALDRLRSASRRSMPLDCIEQGSCHGSGVEQASDPFEACANRDLARRLSASFEVLPRIHKDVIVMREVHGMSYAEMATASGCSKGTIMSRLFHARQRLQSTLGYGCDELQRIR